MIDGMWIGAWCLFAFSLLALLMVLLGQEVGRRCVFRKAKPKRKPKREMPMGIMPSAVHYFAEAEIARLENAASKHHITRMVDLMLKAQTPITRHPRAVHFDEVDRIYLNHVESIRELYSRVKHERSKAEDKR